MEKLSKHGSEWAETQNQINSFLVEILMKIEWRYGEGRAPFKFPPEYIITANKCGVRFYKCIITVEYEPPEVLIYSNKTPGELLTQVIKSMESKFSKSVWV